MNKYILSLLQEIATFGKLSNHPHYKHGCLVMLKNRQVYAHNSLRTHTKSPKPYHTRCAEFQAVLELSRCLVTDFRKVIMYVSRFDKKGNLANSKPCKWCHEMIFKLGIKRVYYSINNTEYGQV
jgi:deoxycytidylate deaminase